MLPQRRLLYHRQIDDGIGTYITDYVECCVGFICAAYLVRCVLSARGSFIKPTKSTVYCTIVMLFCYSTLTLFGGLAHQFLQTVEPYETWHDDMTWLIVWRFGFAISVGFPLALLLIAKFMLEQENLLKLSKTASRIYYASALLPCMGVFAYSIALIWNEKKPFHALPMFITMFVGATLNCVASFIAFCYARRRQNQDITLKEDSSEGHSCDEALVLSKCEDRHPSSRSVSSCTESDGARSTAGRARVRWDLLLRAIAPLVFVAAAFMYLGFTKMGCSNSDDPFANGCPLPNNFNHNAVMHLLHTFAIFMFFAAEVLAMRRGQHHDRDPLEAQKSSTV